MEKGEYFKKNVSNISCTKPKIDAVEEREEN